MRFRGYLLLGTALALLPLAGHAAGPTPKQGYRISVPIAPYTQYPTAPLGILGYLDPTNTTVDPAGQPTPVSSASPLPVAIISGGSSGGGGTSGGSVTQGTSPWVDNITQIGGVTINLGRTTMSASLPVTLASDQPALPVTGAFFQATQPVSQPSGAVWSSNLYIGGAANAVGNPAFAQITNFPATQAVSGAVGEQGVVATTAPSSANGSTQTIRLDAGNRQMVNGSEVTQPVSVQPTRATPTRFYIPVGTTATQIVPLGTYTTIRYYVQGASSAASGCLTDVGTAPAASGSFCTNGDPVYNGSVGRYVAGDGGMPSSLYAIAATAGTIAISGSYQ